MPAFRPDTRTLTGGVVALALLLAFDLFASVAGTGWSVDVRTPFGPFSAITLAVRSWRWRPAAGWRGAGSPGWRCCSPR